MRRRKRLAILAGEFFTMTEDPEYEQIGELVTRICQRVDPNYTDRFLKEAAAKHQVPL